jgi:hypothetical protein
MLDVMGNSGRPEFLPSLEGVIQNGADPVEVRARAVYALRFVNAAAASRDLLASLASPETALREAAAGAIAAGSWSESYRAPLEACAASEPVGRIQESCRKTLASNARVASSQ